MIHSVQINAENFQDSVNESQMMIVYISAPWCGPCKQLSPIVENICEEMGNKVTLAKVDADEHMDLVKSLNVRNIPTLLFYRKGEVLERTTGLKTKMELLKILENLSVN
jgi:thioredoxin 1